MGACFPSLVAAAVVVIAAAAAGAETGTEESTADALVADAVAAAADGGGGGGGGGGGITVQIESCNADDKRCDGRRDCEDGRDEEGCPPFACAGSDMFTCESR